MANRDTPADEADDLPVVADLRPVITAIPCSEDRTLFAEADNDDGWLATDYTVDVTR
jgi:hypothetical protein